MTKKEKRTLLTGLGLLGAGAGTVSASNAVVPERDWQKLDPFLNLQEQWSATPHDTKQQLYDYLSTASQAAEIKPFGMPMGDFMHLLRKGKWMDSHLAKSLGLADYKWQNVNEAGDPVSNFRMTPDYEHYQKFLMGPVPAYTQYTKEHLNELPGKDSWVDQLKLSVPEGKIPSYDEFQASNYQDNLSRHLDRFLQEHQSASTGKPIQDQITLLKDFDTWAQRNTPADFRKSKDFMDTYAGTSSEVNARNYGLIGKALKKTIRDIPHTVGYGLGAAGLATLGTLGYLKYRKHQKKKKLQKKAVDWLLNHMR